MAKHDIATFAIFIAMAFTSDALAQQEGVQGLLDKLKGAEATQISSAISESPALTAQLNELISSGNLTGIVVINGNSTVPGSRFRADFIDTKILITTGLLQDLKRHQPKHKPGNIAINNTTFVLGHLAFHAAHDKARELESRAAAQSAIDLPSKDGSIDLTAALKTMVGGALEGEARAFIQGWNDVVDNATQRNGKPLQLDQTMMLLNDLRYRDYFIASTRQVSGSVKWEPNSGRIEPDDHNVKTMTNVLMQSPLADIR